MRFFRESSEWTDLSAAPSHALQDDHCVWLRTRSLWRGDPICKKLAKQIKKKRVSIGQSGQLTSRIICVLCSFLSLMSENKGFHRGGVAVGGGGRAPSESPARWEDGAHVSISSSLL